MLHQKGPARARTFFTRGLWFLCKQSRTEFYPFFAWWEDWFLWCAARQQDWQLAQRKQLLPMMERTPQPPPPPPPPCAGVIHLSSFGDFPAVIPRWSLTCISVSLHFSFSSASGYSWRHLGSFTAPLGGRRKWRLTWPFGQHRPGSASASASGLSS